MKHTTGLKESASKASDATVESTPNTLKTNTPAPPTKPETKLPEKTIPEAPFTKNDLHNMIYCVSLADMPVEAFEAILKGHAELGDDLDPAWPLHQRYDALLILWKAHPQVDTFPFVVVEEP